MGLITETVKVTIQARNKTRYEQLGYGKLMCGDIIEVDVNHLFKNSEAMVVCSCDYCNKEYETKYCNYRTMMDGIIPKCCCYDCRSKKVEESNMKVYGIKSTNSIPEIRDKQKATNIKKYGTDNPFGNKEIQAKIKNTFLEKYGNEYATKSEAVRQKIKNTCLDRFGYENALQSPEIRKKMKQTMMNNYGVKIPAQSEVIKEKIKATNLKRYGVENAIQNELIKQKRDNTMINKYGVLYSTQSPAIRKKISDSFYKNQSVNTSIQQKYIAQLFGFPLNHRICYWNVDMYDENDKMVWEYDGGGHWLSVEIGKMSMEDFNRRELIRNNVIRRDGHKMSRIISRKDYLPSDDILLQILSYARQYFSDYPNHSWIEFDIDNGIVRNAENKNGVIFNYGNLRKIKKSDLDVA